jgi:N-acetylglutamate synthase-like GNAT family acetyltransferase
MTMQDVSAVEKNFYLKQFRGKSLLFALRAADLHTDTDLAVASEVYSTLLSNDTRVLLLIEMSEARGEQQRVMALCEWLARAVGRLFPPPLVLPVGGNEEQFLPQVWAVLRTSPLFVGLWPRNPEISLFTCAQRIAVRLKVYKLILLDSAGGVITGGRRLSFMNGPVLHELLRQGEAEWAGLGARRPLLESICLTIEGGVASVTLCPLSGLARELFTYEGCGTLFTLTDYCRVESLGIDDFYEVEKLLERGEREGYLKGRTPQEISQLLLHGYGARLGAAPGELAGFCALLPYPGDNAAEVAGLYTITRFQGEGVASRLITTMIAEGERRGCSYLFACTTQEAAQRLFERHGFRRVMPENVSVAKWQGYDVERKQQLAVYRRELPPPEQSLNL